MDSNLFHDLNFDISLDDYFHLSSLHGLGDAYHVEEPTRGEQSSTVMAPPYLPQGAEAAINLEQDTATGQARRRKAPTLREGDWAPYKERLIDLHITQNLPLREVKEVMQRDHDFFATERQYRLIISKWGLDKKIKAAEKIFIAQKRAQRQLEGGRDLRFWLRGSEVSLEKVDRWEKDHPDLIPSEDRPTPVGLVYSTVSEASSVANTPQVNINSPHGAPTPSLEHRGTTPAVSSPGFQHRPGSDQTPRLDLSPPPTSLQDVAPELTRLREAFERGDSESVGDLTARLFIPFTDGLSFKDMVMVLFEHRVLSRGSIESYFSERIAAVEDEFGKDDHRITAIRLGLVYTLFDILEAEVDGPSGLAWDQEFAKGSLERCRDVLYGLLEPYLSKDVLEDLRCPIDSDIKGGSPQWETYEFVESAVLACIQNNFLIHAIIGCTEYVHLRSIYGVKKTIRELIQKGLIVESREENGKWARKPTPLAAPFLKGRVEGY